MPTWNSRGLRGSIFEELINNTNEYYMDNDLALIQKIPTPITPVKINPDNSTISLAYFDKKSTIDYIGSVQGIPVCFDAKECSSNIFQFSNIHKHQFEFMTNMEKQEGISFILIYFVKYSKIYYMRYNELNNYFSCINNGGKKSINYNDLDKNYLFELTGNKVMYLDYINLDLKSRK